uniref:Osmotin-like protein n=1 Tax=Populus alba TaxID=43335 RepID=A0A4U5QFP9_POPAL|nr:hypothetical protein D5086_0000094100 [Populus alba]
MATAKPIFACAFVILCTLFHAARPELILTLVNNCPFTIYPAIQPNAGHPVLEKGGFPLQTLTHRSFRAPDQLWSGRIWGRTGCTHYDGKFQCATGDCNNKIECNGLGGAPLPLWHRLPSTTATTTSPLMEANLLSTCPDELKFRSPAGHVVGCKSGCEAFRTDELCCRNHYNSPQTCRASSFSEFFKHACPATFTYAHDSPSLMHECSSPRELKDKKGMKYKA